MESIFTTLHDQIEAEATNKEELRQIERDFSQATAPLKLSLQLLTVPGQLQVPDQRQQLVSILNEYKTRLATVLNGDRVLGRFTEEIYTLYFINCYFLEIVRAFSGELDQVTVQLMLIIQTPEQLTAAGFGETIVWSHYLLAILNMVDTVVDYTSDAIINLLMGLTQDKRQYCIAAVNLQLVNSISSGFALLDLKNDSIRRKFDGLKYGLKRINQFVYDLLLRGLITTEAKVVE